LNLLPLRTMNQLFIN